MSDALVIFMLSSESDAAAVRLAYIELLSQPVAVLSVSEESFMIFLITTYETTEPLITGAFLLA